MEANMNLEAPRGPVAAFREQVVIVTSALGRQSRQLGASALRTSAEALVTSAKRLNVLADQLEPLDGSTPQQAASDVAAPVQAVFSGTIIESAEPEVVEVAQAEHPVHPAEEVAARKRAARR